ncbi:hypothetical protein HRbin11_02160 [bacterium HR11]|nr:hypothetical protein HRbin11_02160 [bacterium HR11]
MDKALVLTVGVGKDVDRSLNFAIEHHNPRFILFFCTPQSREYAEKVVQSRSISPSAYHIDEYSETGDVQKLVFHYEEVIRRVLFTAHGFRAGEVYVDYTRGTKAMSAAVDYVAISLELAGISYIEGERGDGGQVKSGTERLLSFQPLGLLFRRHWEMLVHLFNRGHFASVLDRVEALRHRVIQEAHRSRLDFLAGLAEACEAWDILHYEEAAQRFRQVIKNFEDLILELHLKDDLQRASDIVHAIWNNRCKSPDCNCGLFLGPRTAVDLLANADRRAAEHRYDVAVALLYRLMEFIAQRRLHDRGLRTDDVRLGYLPENVRSKWEARVGIDGRLKVGMVQGYELLADLGDSLGRRFLELYQAPTSRLKPYLESRNMSPLAHGFQPVGSAVFEKLRDIIVQSFLPELIPDWHRRLGDHRLPHLPEGA